MKLEAIMRKMLLAGCLVLFLAACGDKAKELYETAQFEEKQFNKTHAAELYRQIEKGHPSSPYAAQARARLTELEKQ
jgi:outer membrane protein assembly factor BamD (BamD/ComL family)